MSIVFNLVLALAAGLLVARCFNFTVEIWATIPGKHGKNWITYSVLSFFTIIAVALGVLAFMAVLAL